MPKPVSTRLEGSVAVITIDNPPVNAMSLAVRRGLIEAVEAAAANAAVTALVLTGAGTCFVAGADVKEMSQPPLPPYLSDVVQALDRLERPIVAAINGVALGGGLEIALACDLRIAHPRASVGLPETRLGLVPGAGGTQRLPRLVGVARAVELIAGARIVKAGQALAFGIIDRLEDDVVVAAIHAAGSTAKRRVSSLAVPAADKAGQAPATASKKNTAPGVAEATRLIELAATASFAEGLAEERRIFLSLRESDAAKALRHVFFAERAADRVPGLDGVKPRRIARVGVIGAGTMGAAIAACFADAGYPVDLVERDEAASQAGVDRVSDIYQRQAASGRLTQEKASERLGLIISTSDWNVLANDDLVVEAAFETMAVKTEIFERLDSLAKPGTILASNTSYLDLDKIASATKRPQDVVGLHFFAPANVMKLLEVVRGKASAPDVLATALAMARKLGKQPVVAGNAHGFIGNRIYAAYRRHAEYLMEDGASPYEIDAALVDFGFAMGVFAVSDLSGLDISYAIRRSLDATRDPNERYVAIADRLVESGRLGRKSGAGYYSYAGGKPEPDPVTEGIVASERASKSIHPRSFSAAEIQRRVVAVMANEGAAILEEGIALRGSDIDLVLINGYGFPRAKGGPMWLADQFGLAAIVAEIKAAAEANPGSIRLGRLLERLAANGGSLAQYHVE